MKRLIGLLAIAVLGGALALFAQNGNSGTPPGQNQGNAPHAYCDKDGDGICDYTGLPVGQCRQANCPGCQGAQGQCPRGNGQGQGQGRGPGSGSCPRNGAGQRGGPPARR